MDVYITVSSSKESLWWHAAPYLFGVEIQKVANFHKLHLYKEKFRQEIHLFALSSRTLRRSISLTHLAVQYKAGGLRE